VRQVGVDLDEPLVAPLEADPEAVPVRVAEAVLAGPHDHLDASELLADLAGERGGAVRAAVVDHEDVDLGSGRPDPVQDLADVGRLLVGGHHDEGPHGPGTYRSAPCTPRSHRVYSS